MDSINSVSKGIFVFKNGKSIKKLEKQKSTRLVNPENENQKWYEKFQELWQQVEEKIEKIQSNSYEQILSSLLSFIRDIDFEEVKNLQTAVLLTGVNQTDHLKHFETLSRQIENNCTSMVTILKSRDCPNIKSTIEKLVDGFINQTDEDEEESLNLKKKQLTLPVFESWYNHNYGSSATKTSIVVMIADFEQFNPTCIQELISILGSYANRLPLVLIVGVATAFKTLHNVLPDHITSRLDVNVFQSESSTVMLNKILEEVILSHRSPFQLSGKSFQILMDIFLFYDYSLHSFIKGYKIFMLEHFSSRPMSALFKETSLERFKSLTTSDCAYIRNSCMSFRKLVESEEQAEVRRDWITNDDFMRSKLESKAKKVGKYLFEFHCCLRILVALFEELPKNEIGKLVRELYPICIASDVTKLEEYQECFKLLRFTSKEKFLEMLEKIELIIQNFVGDEKVSKSQKRALNIAWHAIEDHRKNIEAAGMSPVKDATQKAAKSNSPGSEVSKKGTLGRQEMMAKLKESAQKNPQRVLIEYEVRLGDCLEYLKGLMERHLKPAKEAPAFHEFFVFSDCQSVRRQIVGAPRGALHNALFNPHHYLQCPCCLVSESDQVLATMPDSSIAYKLHLESNKFINLYDWLQAFSMVIELNEDEEDISPEVQARFIRAIGELQFLGFIKNAKNKTDHAIRLTF